MTAPAVQLRPRHRAPTRYGRQEQRTGTRARSAPRPVLQALLQLTTSSPRLLAASFDGTEVNVFKLPSTSVSGDGVVPCRLDDRGATAEPAAPHTIGGTGGRTWHHMSWRRVVKRVEQRQAAKAVAAMVGASSGPPNASTGALCR